MKKVSSIMKGKVTSVLAITMVALVLLGTLGTSVHSVSAYNPEATGCSFSDGYRIINAPVSLYHYACETGVFYLV
jgi:hypothetical protein